MESMELLYTNYYKYNDRHLESSYIYVSCGNEYINLPDITDLSFQNHFVSSLYEGYLVLLNPNYDVQGKIENLQERNPNSPLVLHYSFTIDDELYTETFRRVIFQDIIGKVMLNPYHENKRKITWTAKSYTPIRKVTTCFRDVLVSVDDDE